VEQLVAGIGVAAISGITFLAYKHPDAYKKVFIGLFVIFASVMVGLVIWDLSNLYAHLAAIHYIKIDKLEEAKKTVRLQSPLYVIPYLGCTILGIIIYISLLSCLPALLGEDKAVKK
jgi:hypothetical protein